MARVYTEEILQYLNKTRLIKLILKTHIQQNNTINTLTKEIKEIHRSFKKLESELIVVKQVNTRRECAEFVGTLLLLNMIKENSLSAEFFTI